MKGMGNMKPPGRLTLDFGDEWTVVAYWDQQENCARPLHLPEISKSGHFAIRSVIAYASPVTQPLIGCQIQDVQPNTSGLFCRLQAEALCGKREYRHLNDDGWRKSRWDAARDFVAAVLAAAAKVLGVTAAELPSVAFVAPSAAMADAVVWGRYRGFVEETARTLKLQRWRLVEQPWAAAWGSGLELRPGGAYGLLHIEETSWEAAVVRVANRLPDDNQERRLRLLARVEVASPAPDIVPYSPEFFQQGEWVLAQIKNRLRELGIAEDELQGVVLLGTAGEGAAHWLREQLFPLPVYDRYPVIAAACGAAALMAGVESCGYIRHEYALRYWDSAMDEYRCRTIVPAGTFFPSREPIITLPVRASYPGQSQIGLVLCRMPERQWHSEALTEGSNDGEQTVALADFPAKAAEVFLNEGDPFLLSIPPVANEQEWVAELSFAIDRSRQLTVSVRQPDTGVVYVMETPILRLI